MLKKLQQKWKVGLGRLLLIIATFAIGGSLCGYIGKKIMVFTDLEKNLIWWILYVFLLTLLWPLAVIVVSIPLGQFVFFKNYLKRVFARFRRNK
ncbi:MAG: DUF6787 family protein [Ferruginibacter sp.]|nr:hypothetical protein [Ferruginibacter sp.]